MFLKHNFVTSLFLLCCISAFWDSSTATYCSLDRMKKFAMEACEHLFETFEARERRSIDHGHLSNSASLEPNNNFHYVRRSIYPQGGYLKMGLFHYRKLSQLDVTPRYKAKKLSQLHHDNKKMRFKRNDENYSNSLSYCCYYECDEDFFC